MDNSKIAILSGKGGTGKTLCSVNLASVAKNSIYIDCDVEEPNGHLFFKPEILETENVIVKMPKVDNSLCTGCRKCVDFCNFNALAYINKNIIVFEDICHSCGGCKLVCPSNAISEKEKTIGKIQSGKSRDTKVFTGILNTGEASGIPIIKRLLAKNESAEENIFIDCPPGSACIVMDSIKDADFCVLVAEPTIFGTHNLNMVYELVKIFNKSFGVILNKCIEGENPSEKFCIKKGINILGKIPYDNELGKLNSNGKIVAREHQKYFDLFYRIYKNIAKELKNETIINP